MTARSAVDGPSLVFVVADTTRADVFAEPDVSSTLVAEARAAGRIYERATSPAPWTAPAHASMFTGLDPGEHGIWRPNLFDGDGRPRAKVVQGDLAERWLPAKLQHLGYRTLGVSANPWVAPYFGFDLGFDRFLSLKEWGPRWASKSISARAARRLPEPVASRLRRRRLKKKLSSLGQDAGASRSLETITEWLEERDGPFFAFLNFMEPHWPYRPPADFEGFSSSERRHAVDLLARLGQFKRFSIEAFLRRAGLEESDRAMLRKLYASEVRYLHGRLVELVERLAAAGRGLDDTVIVVVSDHGEQLGEHGLFGHGSSLYEELLHVPLVVLGPPDLVGRGSESERVSTQALYEAMQAWARCERPSLNDGPVFAEGEGMWYQPVVQRLQAEPSLEAKLKATAWAVYEGDWKYVRDETGAEALFDLADDPSETHDIRSTGPLDEMRDVMAKALAGRRPRVSHERPDVAGEMDPEVEAQLRSLGYM